VFGFSSYHWRVEELSEDDRRALATLNGASGAVDVRILGAVSG
jgi:hypothetical protein